MITSSVKYGSQAKTKKFNQPSTIMRNRVANASVAMLLALATFVFIKLIVFFISFFNNVGIDTSAMANLS